jgi:hypothetical protein
LARVCGHSSGLQDDPDEMDHGFEALVGFVVARGDPAKLFEFAEEVLDQMAPLIHFGIVGNAGGPVGFGRDHRHSAPLGQLGTNPVTVEGFVGEQGGEVEFRQERGNPHAVVPLSRQQDEAHKIAERIDQSDDFGRQAATRAADGLSLRPPLAPVPC